MKGVIPMSRKNVYCIIDTETANMTDVYNMGLVIFTKKELLFAREYVNIDVFDNDDVMNNAYYLYKKPLYREMDVVYNTTKGIIRDFAVLLNKFHVTHLLAYNLEFDVRSLTYTANKYANINLSWKNMKMVDIMRNSVETLCVSRNYKKFCNTYGYKTEKGNYQYKAETIIRYLTDNVQYDEQHTALQDCIDEMYIFQRLLKRKKKITFGCRQQLWKLLQ